MKTATKRRRRTANDAELGKRKRLPERIMGVILEGCGFVAEVSAGLLQRWGDRDDSRRDGRRLAAPGTPVQPSPDQVESSRRNLVNAVQRATDAVSTIRFLSDTTTPPGGSRVTAKRVGSRTSTAGRIGTTVVDRASATEKTPPSTGKRSSRVASKIQS
jgi:hypothetical protein